MLAERNASRASRPLADPAAKKSATDSRERFDDEVFWGGVYIIVGEAEDALNDAAKTWHAAHALAMAPD